MDRPRVRGNRGPSADSSPVGHALYEEARAPLPLPRSGLRVSGIVLLAVISRSSGIRERGGSVRVTTEDERVTSSREDLSAGLLAYCYRDLVLRRARILGRFDTGRITGRRIARARFQTDRRAELRGVTASRGIIVRTLYTASFSWVRGVR